MPKRVVAEETLLAEARLRAVCPTFYGVLGEGCRVLVVRCRVYSVECRVQGVG